MPRGISWIGVYHPPPQVPHDIGGCWPNPRVPLSPGAAQALLEAVQRTDPGLAVIFPSLAVRIYMAQELLAQGDTVILRCH